MNEKAKFLIDMVLVHEGGYVNDPDDRGGETYRGIAKASHPKWAGWALLERHKPLSYNQIVKGDDELDNLVMEVYYKNYYAPLKLDSVTDLMISAHLMCQGVNSGPKASVKLLQKSINVVYGANLVVDGVIGKKTLKYVNDASKLNELRSAFIRQRELFYQAIVNGNPSQKKFLNGWLNRVKGTTKAVEEYLGIGDDKNVQTFELEKLDRSVKTEASVGNVIVMLLKWVFNLFFKRKK